MNAYVRWSSMLNPSRVPNPYAGLIHGCAPGDLFPLCSSGLLNTIWHLSTRRSSSQAKQRLNDLMERVQQTVQCIRFLQKPESLFLYVGPWKLMIRIPAA